MKQWKFEIGAMAVLVTSAGDLAMIAREESEAERLKKEVAEGSEESDVLHGVSSLMGMVEAGMVIGRAEYVNANDSYLIRYRAGDGRQVENWIPEDGLVSEEEARNTPVEETV